MSAARLRPGSTGGRRPDARAPGNGVSGNAWQPDPNGPGLIATGSITANAPAVVGGAALAVVCIGTNGEVLGATSTHLLANLEPGVALPFETVEGTPPLTASQCATTVGFAQRYDDLNG